MSLIDRKDCVAGYHTYQRLKKITDEIIPEINPEDFYMKYQLYINSKHNLRNENSILNKRVCNWLYTVKCETGASGLKFIHIIIKALFKTLKRDLTDLQYEYVRLLLDIFFTQRNLYM